MEVSLGLAFGAGVISFVSPCVLALLPVYLAYLGETAAGVVAVPAGGAAALSIGSIGRQPLLRQAVLFTRSFAAIFVLLGSPPAWWCRPAARHPVRPRGDRLAVIALGGGILTMGASSQDVGAGFDMHHSGRAVWLLAELEPGRSEQVQWWSPWSEGDGLAAGTTSGGAAVRAGPTTNALSR